MEMLAEEMVCRRFSKSSSYTSLFLLNLFKDGNVSGFFCFYQ
ncbi:hypothetical protein T4C_2961 [Trichinella pseudospiralis]|uniref:Uncharacterized protein n=1 Tax=Trichinella pseudospiralis TaxID=6337 RepID=A0A0V1GB10_TRIPS|nr:hypothetical protein T4C_2961 [Trichinella pseudospiralis]